MLTGRQWRRQDQSDRSHLAARARPRLTPCDDRGTGVFRRRWQLGGVGRDRRHAGAGYARHRHLFAGRRGFRESCASAASIGKALGSAAAFADHLRVVWLTPAMDPLFNGPASERRRFLDRLVLAVDAQHSSRVAALERSLRSRNRLLEDATQRLSTARCGGARDGRGGGGGGSRARRDGCAAFGGA